MIFNPVIQSSGGGVKYTVQNDQYNIFYPTEARPGQYVVNPSGTYFGTVTIYDETGTYIIYRLFDAGEDVNDLPPKVREVLESAPSTYAPPVGGSGYLYFVMPEENVKVVTSS